VVFNVHRKDLENKKMYVFRDARIGDINAIADLHAQSWRENYASVLSQDYLDNRVLTERQTLWTTRLSTLSEEQFILVVENEGEVIGFVCAFANRHEKYGTILDNLHVKQLYKGKGLGCQLMSKVAKWVVERDAEQGLFLEVLECNQKAIEFYERRGGQRVAEGYWQTPCGNEAKEYIYYWASPAKLL
jgi:ribosomal protein S18 acetylase RimI-like enzyme